MSCRFYGALPLALLYALNPDTGAITNLVVESDRAAMNWVHEANGVAFPWVGPSHAWGLGTVTVDGKSGSWRDFPGVFEACVSRRVEDGDLVERYEFRNVSARSIAVKTLDINAPFNDNYPKDQTELLTRRCHAHVWTGDSAAYVCAMKIGGKGPHLGLIVTEGDIAGYELKERAASQGWSNFRGVICLSPADRTLRPGESFAVAWRLFAHDGWDDFYRQLLRRGGVYVRAPRYTASVGESIDYEIVTGSGVEKRRWTCERPGLARVEIPYGDGRRTHAEFLGLPPIGELLLTRARFIVRNQFVTDEGPYHGALVPYDNETNRQYRNWELPRNERRVDTSEGGERHGMGIFLAMVAQRGYREEFLPYLTAHADFVRHRLQEPDFTLFQEVERPSRMRPYNYPWCATFYVEMYNLTGERKYVEWAYGTMMRLFTGGNIRLPDTFVDPPVKSILDALTSCGMTEERVKLLDVYCRRCEKYTDPTAKLEIHEVGMTPDQLAGFLTQFVDLYKITADRRYLDFARRFAPLMDGMLPHQPSACLNDMALHHWDGYWFGKRRMWGDTCPQDWNGGVADYFRGLAEVTGDRRYARRADGLVLQLLSLFDPDGRAYCVYLYPDRVNGLLCKFRDPLANDQDWALVFLMRNFPSLRPQEPQPAAKTPSGGCAVLAVSALDANSGDMWIRNRSDHATANGFEGEWVQFRNGRERARGAISVPVVPPCGEVFCAVPDIPPVLVDGAEWKVGFRFRMRGTSGWSQTQCFDL